MDADCSRAKCIGINMAEVGDSVPESPYLTGARMAQRSCLSLLMIGTPWTGESEASSLDNSLLLCGQVSL
jgi:hypothetical protein